MKEEEEEDEALLSVCVCVSWGGYFLLAASNRVESFTLALYGRVTLAIDVAEANYCFALSDIDIRCKFLIYRSISILLLSRLRCSVF